MSTLRDVIVITDDEDTEIDAEVLPPSATPQPALSDEATAGIIAGAVLMGLLLLVVLIVLCVLCIRRKKHSQQAQFCKCGEQERNTEDNHVLVCYSRCVLF